MPKFTVRAIFQAPALMGLGRTKDFQVQRGRNFFRNKISLLAGMPSKKASTALWEKMKNTSSDEPDFGALSRAGWPLNSNCPRT